VRLDRPGAMAEEPGATLGWITENGIETLNVAGPRESQRTGIYAAARAFLGTLIGAAR
jgi:hypothetical protein